MSAIVEAAPVDVATRQRRIEIDFMYIDLEVCTRCRGTDANLEASLAEVTSVLASTGRELTVRRTLVESEEQARALGFVSSPTLRVNGRDIALEFRESRCESCEACACNGTVECRVWVWQGQEYTEAPVAMIVDAILGEVYGGLAPQPVAGDGEVPENLQRFFAGKAQQQSAQEAPAACCSPTEQASCCAEEAKASCCGEAGAGTCGCK